MTSSYDCVHPYEQLRTLRAEQQHLRSLSAAGEMWHRAAALIDGMVTNLNNRKTSMLGTAWFDEGGRTFGEEVNKSLNSMIACRDIINRSGVVGQINDLSLQFPNIYNSVNRVCEEFKAADEAGRIKSLPDVFVFSRKASPFTDQLDRHYDLVAAAMRKFEAEAPDWVGPRAALADRGNAPDNTPSSNPTSSSAGTPTNGAAGDPASAESPESQSPDNANPGEPQQVSDALGAATSALQAAQELLGGTQVPDAVPVSDLGGLGLDPAAYGSPRLAGLDAAAFGGSAGGAASAPSVGGPGAGSTNITGPGGAVGAGMAPLSAGGLARGLAAPAAGAGSTPPMYPPNAGAAGARQAAAGIKPGNSNRSAAESGPRPRRGTSAGPVTPGVALTGRAGAAAPKPAAQRSWDNDNDSLQVLDEHLWQVNPPEEETHGQDRRRPGRDGHDRAAAHRSPDAELAGPGGRANQPTRAR